jgi:hypothetical protein
LNFYQRICLGALLFSPAIAQAQTPAPPPPSASQIKIGTTIFADFTETL